MPLAVSRGCSAIPAIVLSLTTVCSSCHCCWCCSRCCCGAMREESPCKGQTTTAEVSDRLTQLDEITRTQPPCALQCTATRDLSRHRYLKSDKDAGKRCVHDRLGATHAQCLRHSCMVGSHRLPLCQGRQLLATLLQCGFCTYAGRSGSRCSHCCSD